MNGGARTLGLAEGNLQAGSCKRLSARDVSDLGLKGQGRKLVWSIGLFADATATAERILCTTLPFGGRTRVKSGAVRDAGFLDSYGALSVNPKGGAGVRTAIL